MARKTAYQPIEHREPIEIGLIQGMVPDSQNEWWFSQALDKLEMYYIYQYQVGMFGVRGSQKIDFLVKLPTGWAACFIQGKYWHGAHTETEDQLKQAAAERLFGKGNVFVFTEEETADLQAALAAIREKML